MGDRLFQIEDHRGTVLYAGADIEAVRRRVGDLTYPFSGSVEEIVFRDLHDRSGVSLDAHERRSGDYVETIGIIRGARREDFVR